MASLVLGDDRQGGANRGIGCVFEGFERLDRRHRFADAAFGEDRSDQRRKVSLVEAGIDVQRAGTEVAIAVGGSQREGELGVFRFVAHGALCRHDEIGGRADGEQLQRESSEGGDRGVLHACDLEPGGR